MTTWFVSRHAGAAQWARTRGHLGSDAREVLELVIADVQAGDVVMGNLPAHLAAEVCRRGASYQHLRLDRPLEERGREIGPDALEQAGAALEPYRVEAVPHFRPSRLPPLMVCVVSREGLPNLLPLKVENLRPSDIVLLASAEMHERATVLKQAIQQWHLPQPELCADLPDKDVNAIRNYGQGLAERLSRQHPRRRLLLNLTGGNKLIALGLLEGMRDRFEAFYCDTMHDRIEWLSPAGRDVQVLAPGLLSLNDYLLAQGLRAPNLEQPSPPRSQEQDARYLGNAAATLSQDFFRRLNNAALARDPSIRHTSSDARLVMASGAVGATESQVAERLEATGYLEKSDGRFVVPPERQKWSFLAGGWLEYYCAAVARDLQGEGLNACRWATSLKVQPLGDRYNNALQELDAVLVHRNRMLVIECKTGQQLAGDKPENQAILNRLEVVADQVAGALATRFLLSTVDNFDQAVLRRAARYRIKLFTRHELRSLREAISEWMRT